MKHAVTIKKFQLLHEMSHVVTLKMYQTTRFYIAVYTQSMTAKPLCADQFIIQFLPQNLSKLPCITEWMNKHIIIGSTAAAT